LTSLQVLYPRSEASRRGTDSTSSATGGLYAYFFFEFFEAADCRYFCVVYSENAQQLGYLKDFMEFSA
jgi:hypothetical protein